MGLPSPYASRAVIAGGRFIFRYRNVLFPVCIAGLGLVVFVRRPPAWEPWDAGFDVGGVALAIVGETIRALTVGFDYIKRGGVNKRIHAGRLVTSGMFANCRNPLYFGNLLMIAGILLIGVRPDATVLSGILAVAVLATASYVAMIAAEEEYLRQNFGEEYKAYCRSVRRWPPRFGGMVRLWRGGRFNVRRVLLKEYSSTYSWCLGAFAFEAIEHVGDPAFLGGGEMIVAEILIGAATLAFVSIFVLKKTSRLRERAA